VVSALFFWRLMGGFLVLLGVVALGTAVALRRRREPSGTPLLYAALAFAVSALLLGVIGR
jgi:hypothetical protein